MGVWLLNTCLSGEFFETRNKVICLKKQTGSATVEAAIVMPLVIIVFMSILSVIRIVSTYSMVQHALNQVAEELSQYCYVYPLSGLKQQHDGLLDNIRNAAEELKSQTDALKTFYKSVESISGNAISLINDDEITLESILDIVSKIENIKESSGEIMETINEILKDPVCEIQLIGLALSDALLSKSKTTLLGTVAKTMLKNNLSEDLGADAGRLEKLLKIEGGIEKLDFSGSTFFNDKQTIDLIVEYTVKPEIFIIPVVRLRNRACVFSWAWGVDSGISADTEAGNESIWNIDKNKSSTSQHLARGCKIDKLFAAELKKKIGEHSEITPDNFKTIDLIEYAHNGMDGSLIMIFSLNPFLPAYNSKSTIIGTIKQNLNSLINFQRYQCRDFIIDMALLSGNYKRVAYVIIPENKVLPDAYIQAFEECRIFAGKKGIELIQVQKYGEYYYAEEGK